MFFFVQSILTEEYSKIFSGKLKLQNHIFGIFEKTVHFCITIESYRIITEKLLFIASRKVFLVILNTRGIEWNWHAVSGGLRCNKFYVRSFLFTQSGTWRKQEKLILVVGML